MTNVASQIILECKIGALKPDMMNDDNEKVIKADEKRKSVKTSSLVTVLREERLLLN